MDDDLKYLQLYSLTDRENFESFFSDLEQLKVSGLQVDSITSDGQKGLIKAVKQIFPQAIHQRCVIHVQRMSLNYLTRFPKTEAGKMLRILVVKLHEIKSYQRRDIWIKLFNRWCEEYDDFLKEKSESPSGRKWYTHKLLRRTRSLIKNALPNLFHYVDDSKIPKSTNGLETRFSYLKNNLKIHRGLTKKNRRNFILWYNYFKYKS
ncbi:MAG: transposase [Candidatus Jacksonbacteria bacterium]